MEILVLTGNEKEILRERDKRMQTSKIYDYLNIGCLFF